MAVNLRSKIRSRSPHLTIIVKKEFSKTISKKQKDIVLAMTPRKA